MVSFLSGLQNFVYSIILLWFIRKSLCLWIAIFLFVQLSVCATFCPSNFLSVQISALKVLYLFVYKNNWGYILVLIRSLKRNIHFEIWCKSANNKCLIKHQTFCLNSNLFTSLFLVSLLRGCLFSRAPWLIASINSPLPTRFLIFQGLKESGHELAEGQFFDTVKVSFYLLSEHFFNSINNLIGLVLQIVAST